MRNLLLTLRYDGTNFHGWQIQPNGESIQERLQEAFRSVSGKSENIIGCSRTDAGVHANMFCANVRTECTVPAEKLPNALNFYLPSEISVYDCKEVDFDFHARYNAKGKEYIYLIDNEKYRNPFYENKALFYPYKLNVDEMNRNAKDFIGVYDFSAFCSADTEIQDKVREIYDCRVEKDGDLIKVTISGNGFLYNMVRIIVGTLLSIENGKIESGTIPKIIESKDRKNAGVTVAPDGLYLNKVFYWCVVKKLEEKRNHNEKEHGEKKLSAKERHSKRKHHSEKKPSKSKFAMKIKTANRLKLVSVIIVILLLVSIAAARVGGITFTMITDAVRTFIASIGAGPGYPYSLSGIAVSDVSITNSDIVLLDDNSVRVLNSTAKEISNIQHGFDHPMLQTNAGRILIYDIGAKQFKIQSKTRVLFEKQTDYMILTAALGKDGSAIVATRANGSESMFTVYDKKHNPVYQWAFAKEHVVACDISDNGKKFAVGVMGVENGSIYSIVYVFDKKQESYIEKFDYKDTAITSIKYLNDDKFIVFGNNTCQIIDSTTVSQDVDVKVNTPSRLFVSDNNNAVLVLSKYSSTTQKVVKVYNNSGNELFTVEISGIVKSVATDGKYVAVLTDSQVYIYNMKGALSGRADVTSDAEDVVVKGKKTYVISSESIVEYSSVEIK